SRESRSCKEASSRSFLVHRTINVACDPLDFRSLKQNIHYISMINASKCCDAVEHIASQQSGTIYAVSGLHSGQTVKQLGQTKEKCHDGNTDQIPRSLRVAATCQFRPVKGRGSARMPRICRWCGHPSEAGP